MNLSWKIFNAFGIPVRLHFSMIIIPIIAMNWYDDSWLFTLLLVLFLFGSVLLHELGHALTARRYNVHTKDIILTPLGGVARIVNMPQKPTHEIAIAIAGPLVSFAIAGFSFALLSTIALAPSQTLFKLCSSLFVLNLLLAVFNLIPALPMDGGRVLRGLLAIKRNYLSATITAVKISKGIAIAGGIVGIIGNIFNIPLINAWTLPLIAVFIYFSANAELRNAQYREAAKQGRGAGFGFPFGNPFGSGPGTSRPGQDPNVRTWQWKVGPDSFNHPPGGSHDPDFGAPPNAKDPDSRPIVIQGGKAQVIRKKDSDKN